MTFYLVFATMLERTETSRRFYPMRPMVFLFSRPILPYYNKGKKTISSYLNFIFLFFHLSDCVAYSANLECVRFKRRYHNAQLYAPTGRTHEPCVPTNQLIFLPLQ